MKLKRDDIYKFLLKTYEEKFKNPNTSLKNDNINDKSEFRRSIVDDKKIEVSDMIRGKKQSIIINNRKERRDQRATF